MSKTGIITVDNYKNNKTGIYVGRFNHFYALKASPLANIPPISRDPGDLAANIAQYKITLWKGLNSNGAIYYELWRIAKLLLAGKDVTLLCWCVDRPNNAEIVCHAFVIKDCLNYMINKFLKDNPHKQNSIDVGGI